MKTRTAANAMRTIRLVCEEFFEFLELDSSEAEGPSAAFPRFLSVAGGGGAPESGRVGAGFDGVGDIDGDNDGAAVVELNRFPSFLHTQEQLKKT